MTNETVLKVRANYNGQEFTLKLVGASAEEMADCLLGAIKGRTAKNEISDFS